MITPELLFDFTTASLDSRVTFTRANATATQINANGYIESVAADTPRFDYDPVTLICKGLLIEESRQNACLRSESFNSSPTWTATAITVSQNTLDTLSPSGTNTAAALFETATTSAHVVGQGAIPLNTAVTLSCFIKANGRSHALFGNTQQSIGIDLQTQTVIVGAGSPSNSFCYSYGNGWYRVGFTATFTSNNAINIYTSTDGVFANRSYLGDVTKGIFVFGAQVETGADVTTYIPTTTTAVTRNADVATITGTDFSDWWQAGRGGVSVSAIPSTVIGTRPLIQFDDATADNLIALQGNTTDPELYIVDSTTPQAQIDAGTIAAGTPYTLTGWWQTDFCAARLNNSARVVDNSATIPTVTQARLGSDGTNYLNGHLATINYYDQFSSRIYTRRKNKAVFSVL